MYTSLKHLLFLTLQSPALVILLPKANRKLWDFLAWTYSLIICVQRTNADNSSWDWSGIKRKSCSHNLQKMVCNVIPWGSSSRQCTHSKVLVLATDRLRFYSYTDILLLLILLLLLLLLLLSLPLAWSGLFVPVSHQVPLQRKYSVELLQRMVETWVSAGERNVLDYRKCSLVLSQRFGISE